MSDHSARTADGARDTVALLEALVRNDAVGAQSIVDHCDPMPTVFCLASAWVALVEHQGLDAGELIETMRRSIHA
ncbi:hypothetical protein [Nocardia sp. NBC_01327]|uniref:hypothetical protein n=1 Tax=Nocardia sp. NBC_01327 TaxID=2903593 RepID=UPI002E1312DB|nr:hypothetical protein OG326_24100 [Nocardia sp. NBC_01327]